VGVGVLIMLLLALLQDYRRHRDAEGRESLNPDLLLSGLGLEPSGDTTEWPDHNVHRFRAYGRSEGMAEFEEAMATERLRTQSDEAEAGPS